ncbi:MAG: VacB/RNase II family 3'-5' exoribonuclease [Candidatus Latescibacteria bacterium]|nr:VacB/RNase II family 3'-5' exoribonuclease [Candidatus Latescibacterota bacterium]
MTRPRVGLLQRTRFGYGFVRVEGDEDDLFIPPHSMGGALHGDLVVAAYVETRREGDAHEVVEVLERTQAGIVGTLEPRGRQTILRPARPEYPGEIPLLLHGRRSVPRGGRAIVRLKRTPADPLEGTVIAVLGDGDPREDSLMVALEEGLRVEFDPAALGEASRHGESSVSAALHGRADFREDLVVTIDPADAKDHDDALSIRRGAGGRHRVGVHIADVSHYVRAGTALDLEARARGNSVYLADATFPMLPDSLSGGLCSLVEGKDRLTLSVVVDLDEEGGVHEARVVEGAIRSAASLTYPEAARLLRDGGGGIPAALSTLDALARALRRRRMESGGLDLDLPEVRASLDERGEPVEFVQSTRLPTHGLIEEFMLLANRIVGGRALARELPFFYRVHERPRYDKLRAFFEAARYLGRSGLAPLVTDAKQLRRWATAGKTTRERLVNLYLLRALEKARYDLVDVGHFGLGARGYAHFTSPIRRYADLANHRIVKRYLLDGGSAHAGDPWAFAGAWMSAGIAAHISSTEVVADDAERSVLKLKAVRFAQQRLGEEARGVIVGVTPGGVFVWLEGWNIEGFLPKRSIGDPSLALAEHGFAFRSKRSRHRFGLGDSMDVVVTRADLDRREIELGCVRRESRRPKRGRGLRPSMGPAHRSRRR